MRHEMLQILFSTMAIVEQLLHSPVNVRGETCPPGTTRSAGGLDERFASALGASFATHDAPLIGGRAARRECARLGEERVIRSRSRFAHPEPPLTFHTRAPAANGATRTRTHVDDVRPGWEGIGAIVPFSSLAPAFGDQ